MSTSYTKIEPSEDSEALFNHRTSDESDQRWLEESLHQQAQHRRATPRVKLALTLLVLLLMLNIVLSASNLAQWLSRRTSAAQLSGLYCKHLPFPLQHQSQNPNQQAHSYYSASASCCVTPSQIHRCLVRRHKRLQRKPEHRARSGLAQSFRKPEYSRDERGTCEGE